MRALPLSMNHLYYFYVIARNKSFTRAARELMVSQSSLSIQMKHLENALGVKLFNRRKTGVELTEAGEVAFQRAERIFHEVEDLINGIEDAEEGVSGRVSIATVNSIGIYLLPNILKKFKEEFPEVRIAIDFKHSQEVIDLVQAGRVDLAVITGNKKYPGLVSVSLRKNKMFLVCNPNHPLAGRSEIDVHDLEKHSFIAYESGTPTRLMMDSLFKRMSLDIEYTIESSNVATMKRMAMVGMGLAMLPEVAVGLELREGLLVRIHIPSLSMAQEITLYTKANRTLSRTAKTFADFLRHEMKRPLVRRTGSRRAGEAE